MTLFAQHGWGKSDKIERGIEDGSIEGVLMSPRDESPEKLASYLNLIQEKYPKVKRIVDPQFYASTIWPVRDGKLSEYPHYNQQLTQASFTAAEIRTIVSSTLEWQDDLNVSAIVSPTVMVDDLDSRWAQIAMMLAQESVERGPSKPLFISLVVGEDVLRQRKPVDGWLDILTQLDVQGFYIIVKRSSPNYRQDYEPDVLASLLHICYSLAELNEYQVIMGYSDMVTLLLHAVGVTGTGAGWYSTLKQFNLRRFQPVTGGSRPRSRYSSQPLLNSIYITELDGIHSVGRAADVLSKTRYDGRFGGATNPENVLWPDDEAALHHWSVLAGIKRSIERTSIGGRLDAVRNYIAQAIAIYAQIETMVPFSTETGPTHLDNWLEALKKFRSDAAV